MATGRAYSISTRLMMMNMLVSAVALLLACAGFFAYDQITFRNGLVRTLSAQAQIIASSSVSAILFNDPRAATGTLSALRGSQNIVSAGIFTLDRRPLAQYSRDSADEVLNLPALPDDRVEGHWFRTNHVVLIREILSEGKPVGFVYLRASLQEIDRRLKRYALITIAVLLVSLLAATLVSSAFGRTVAQPVIELAKTAQQISRDKNYNIRMKPLADQNELGVLVNSFNEMLQELHSSHDELEQRVSERTQELVSANREMEAFSYSVSHDLRGPLDAINGFSYVLANQYGAKLGTDGRELVQQIRAGGKRMTVLIDDLLNLSRVTSRAMSSEKVNLSDMARSIMDDLCRQSPARNVEFKAVENAEVSGDPRLLRIALENLLQNSWKYTSHHEQAHIEFGMSRNGDGGRNVYFIRDDGSGFDPSSAERLFQPFQRLHSTAEFPGNGVGLATVKRIIQRHSGEVWAEGAVEKGATFYFTLGGPRNSSAKS